MSPNIQWEKGSVSVDGTYLELDGHKNYSASYTNSFPITPKMVSGMNRTEYLLDFTNEIQEVYMQVYPEEALENCGIYGTLVLENTIYDVVGQMENKRYLRSTLHASPAAYNTWHLYPVITIPQGADWIISKVNTEDMVETFPDQHITTVVVTPLGQSNAQIYAVWEIPPPVSLAEMLTRFPYSFILGLVTGVISQLISKHVYSWFSGRRSKRKQEEKTNAKVENNELQPVKEIDTIYNAVVNRFDLEIDRKKELDSKATNLIGFVGITASLVTGFGGTYLKMPTIKEWDLSALFLLSPIISFVFVLAFFFISFIFVLRALQIKEFTYVPSAFNLIGAYANSEKETILRDLTDDYAIAIKDNKEENDTKADNIKKAVWSLFVAFAALFFHVVSFLI